MKSSEFRTIAMYLPQYHRTPENDAFWGEGFTDWVSVREAENLVPGQDLPRRPKDGRYYDLSDPEILTEQAKLAAEYGIDGFCFYHYYFGQGRTVLQTPAELLLEHKEIPMPFCFCWANDGWARSWSKRDDTNPWADRYEDRGSGELPSLPEPGRIVPDDPAAGILIEQKYGGRGVWEEHFRYLLPYFQDERYLTKDGKPLFVFYKPELIRDLEPMLDCFRECARQAGLPGLYLIGANLSRAEYGFDAALIHAPSQILPYGREQVIGGVRCFSYRDVWNIIDRAEPVGNMKTCYGGFVDYDDTPRRGANGMLVAGADPEDFETFLTRLVRKNRIGGNDLIFLNAWNEWGECNYLEPDEKNGTAWLEAVRRVREKKEYRTEKEYVLSCFEQAFSEWKGKRLILYGTGANARSVLERFRDKFDFVGIWEDQNAPETFCGLPVLDREKVLETSPDAVVLAAQIASVEPVWLRISGFCREHRIPVLDMYGQDEEQIHCTMRAAKAASPEYMKRLFEPFDMISTELAGTLFREDPEFPGRMLPDRRLRRVLLDACATGRELIFTAEEGMSPARAAEALDAAGFEKYSLYSEEELGRKKCNGLFRLIRMRNPGKKVLHIGKDRILDVFAPRLYGMDSFGWGLEIALPPETDEERRPEISASDPETFRREIAAADVVSFDVFDTLICRNVSRPEDVWRLTESAAAREGLEVPGFTSVRFRAQCLSENPDLEEIYRIAGRITGLSPEDCRRLMCLELEIEERVSRPVPMGVRLLKEAEEAGKRIVLTSDMYLPSGRIRQLLTKNGIDAPEEILVSCERKKRKGQGLLQELKALAGPGAKILHIGDSRSHDAGPAAKEGIRSLLIPKYVPTASEEERNLYADTTLAPFAAGFLAFLIEAAEGTDGILFAARDGWLLYRLYEKIREQRPDLPEGTYFYISRLSALRSAADPKQDLIPLWEEMPSPKQVLTTAYGLPEEALRKETPGDYRDPRDYFRRHAETCRKAAIRNRQNTIRYFERIGLKVNGRYVLADLVSAGTTERWLDRFCPFTLTGYYAGVRKRKDDPAPDHYYAEEEELVCLGDYRAPEYYFASPEPAVTGFDESGSPLFAKEYRTEAELEEIRRIQERIEDYVLSRFAEGNSDHLAVSAKEALKNARPDLCPQIAGLVRDDLFRPAGD